MEQTETPSHPLVNFYIRKFNMTDIQRDDFLNKNLLGNSYSLRGTVYHIDLSRLVLNIQYQATNSDETGGYLLACFHYDSSFKSQMLNFNKYDLVSCTGKLIGVNDCDFTLQFTDIKKDNPSPRVSSNSGSCFIATACYGDYNASEVMVLRAYRDNVLLKTKIGILAVRIYYFISPPFARLLEQSETLKSVVRKNILAPIILKIRQNQ